MQVSETLRVVFKSNHWSTNDAEKGSDREHHRKQSIFRCNWLEDRVSSTCELAGLAYQVSLEKLHRIAILNINSVGTRKKGRKRWASKLSGHVCMWRGKFVPIFRKWWSWTSDILWDLDAAPCKQLAVWRHTASPLLCSKFLSTLSQDKCWHCINISLFPLLMNGTADKLHRWRISSLKFGRRPIVAEDTDFTISVLLSMQETPCGKVGIEVCCEISIQE
jgi:hypothetical protein